MSGSQFSYEVHQKDDGRFVIDDGTDVLTTCPCCNKPFETKIAAITVITSLIVTGRTIKTLREAYAR